MYLGSLIVSPSKPTIQCSEDAAALAHFAHKYNMTQLLNEAEGYLIGEACSNKGKALFGDPTELVAWVILAETCKLDVFLAHAERFMIQHMDITSWKLADSEATGDISQQCFLRVLRGALHGRQEAFKAVVKLERKIASQLSSTYNRTCCCSHCLTHCQGTCGLAKRAIAKEDIAKVDIAALDISITTLTEWHKQDL